MPSHALVVASTGIAVVATVVGVVVFTAGAFRLARIIGAGAPEKGRWNKPGTRVWTALVRTITGDTFTGRPVVAVAHWLVMVAFVLLFLTLIAAYGQIPDPYYSLPILGSVRAWHWLVEFLAAASFLAIATLFIVRVTTNLKAKEEDEPRSSRFFGSTRWQAWFVEAGVALVGAAILIGDGLRYALETKTVGNIPVADFPLTAWWGALLTDLDANTLAIAISVVAPFKIVVSMTWMGVVGADLAMGIRSKRGVAPYELGHR